ncbi:MAG: hypothetical protein KDK05_10815 [Candidatus Competibacteraceae bacterium]|nr:hypothetical protein [Candidatus Competibacteraceae bacterium]
MLPDDRDDRLCRLPDALVAMYRIIWKQAAEAEPLELRRANMGRRAANAWIRRTVDRLAAHCQYEPHWSMP